jgi:hypothetical protein
MIEPPLKHRARKKTLQHLCGQRLQAELLHVPDDRADVHLSDGLLSIGS